MPRALTQLGSAICAAIVSELAEMIHATPESTMAGMASQMVGAHTAATELTACNTVPHRTNWSRPTL